MGIELHQSKTINKPTVKNINVIYDIIHEFIVFHDLTKSKVCESVPNWSYKFNFHRVLVETLIGFFYYFFILVTLKWTSGFTITSLSFIYNTNNTAVSYNEINTHTTNSQFHFILSHLLMNLCLWKKKNRKVNEWDFWFVGLVFSLLQMTFNLAHIALSWSLIRQHTLYILFLWHFFVCCFVTFYFLKKKKWRRLEKKWEKYKSS